VFGRRKDAVLRELKQLLEPFGISRFYTDHWGAYAWQLKPERHFPGKRQIQRIERKLTTVILRLVFLIVEHRWFNTLQVELAASGGQLIHERLSDVSYEDLVKKMEAGEQGS